MTRFLSHLRDRPSTTPKDVDALVSYAAGLGPVVRALTTLAGRETLNGRWLVPSRTEATTWTRFRPGLGEPPLLTALRDAIPLADRVSTAGTDCQRPRQPVALGLPPRRALAAALAHAQRSRPPAPGNRPQVLTPVACHERARTRR
jgi:hypothetical protein